jgi:FAD/FMN-containing dehydrogenase
MSGRVRAALSDVVGDTHVISDPEITARYGRDWTGRWAMSPYLVVRPGSTQEVSEVMRICAQASLAITPQGGNTGLVGGSVPGVPNTVVLSTERLTAHGDVDPVRRQVTVGAGLTIAAVHALAADHDLAYGVDLASRDTATIGGTVATNAGGVRVVTFGETRRNVIGVEAVLPDGSVLSHLEALPKDSAGYDISALMVGSEGTLAVITAVRLLLHEQLPPERVTTLIGVGSLSSALEVIGAAVPREQVLAAEYFDDTGMRLVCEAALLPHPLRDRWPFYLLLETAAEPTLASDVDAAVDRRLWVYRERQPEAAASLGVIHSLDVALPLPALDDFVTRLPEIVSPHRVFTFGHLAEGNLHIQVSGPAADDESVDAEVLHVVAKLGGSISSEHGIGRAKASYLHLCRDASERSAMWQVKRALDPGGLMNPGVLFPDPPRSDATMSS